MNARVVDAQQAAEAVHLLGGKGQGLCRLQQAGANVPPWFCLTPQVGRVVANGRLPAEDESRVLERFNAVVGAESLAAVRSSALDEDSAADSFAGQFETYLCVRRDRVIERVVDCFASASARRAAVYRTARGQRERPCSMAVIVQRMVDSAVSGVMFTANPTTHDRSETVITAAFGLGEGVVADRVETDTFFVDSHSGRVRRQIVAEKRSKVAFDGESGEPRLVQFPPENAPALTEQQIGELVGLGHSIESEFGAPQDIEWGIDEAGTIHILQARPITTLRREQIFDNSNIVESYPGLSLPLTFSFARAAYEETFREASRALGTPEAVLRENRRVHSNLLVLIDGRIYYNILNWYEIFLMLPGFERAVPAWEQALGLPPRLIRQRESRSRRLSLRAIGRLVRQYLLLDRNVRRLLADFDQAQCEFRQTDLSALDAHQLLELFEQLGLRFFGPYSVSVVNDFFAQQLYGLLGRLIEGWSLGDPGSLRNELVRGESGMQSIDPVRSLLSLTGDVQSDERLRDLFEGPSSDAEVLEEVHRNPDWQAFRDAMQRHLDEYGDRSLQELKLETPSLHDQPELIVTMIRNYVAGGRTLEGLRRAESPQDSTAVTEMQARLRRHPMRRAVLGWAVRSCRRMICHRENLRLARTRAFGMFKRIFRAIGRIFADQGLIDDPGDVFYLQVDEIAGEIRGHSATQDLRELVAIRKREYAAFSRRDPPSRIVAHGLAYAGRRESEAGPRTDATTLEGLGCSPGRVRGKARIVLQPEQHLNVRDEILVAPATDPGWVFLMVAAKGLVVEKGSLLSHTAIVGRELGVPTVVGVDRATRTIRDGQEIEIDGQTGEVWIERP